MTVRQAIGAALIAAPFVGFFVFFVHAYGLTETVIVVAAVVAIACSLVAGIWLLESRP